MLTNTVVNKYEIGNYTLDVVFSWCECPEENELMIQAKSSDGYYSNITNINRIMSELGIDIDNSWYTGKRAYNLFKKACDMLSDKDNAWIIDVLEEDRAAGEWESSEMTAEELLHEEMYSMKCRKV